MLTGSIPREFHDILVDAAIDSGRHALLYPTAASEPAWPVSAHSVLTNAVVTVPL